MKMRQLTKKTLLYLAVLAVASSIITAKPAKAMEPYLGQLMIFAGNFEPRGWAQCDGQLLAVSSNDALFSLVGTTYGGDGRTTFGFPDLRGRIPVHMGSGPGLTPRTIGARGGAENVTLTANEIPAHTHTLRAVSAQGNLETPGGHALAYDKRERQYSTRAPDVSMYSDSISRTGGSQAHSNMPPYLTLNYCIALNGVYPSRN